MVKITDTEFRQHRITKVEGDRENGWTITFYDGWSFGVDKDSPVVPVRGMIARLYGEGIGRPIRGLDLNGQTVFYRTPAQERQRHEEWRRNWQTEKAAKYEANREDYARRIGLLPEHFQMRIAAFQAVRPTFNQEFLSYELFCCEEAIKIVKWGEIAEAVESFSKMPHERQKEWLPDLAYSEHSGNTFGMACRLAWLHLRDPNLVTQEHGALCALVGCEEYGCPPAREKL